MGGAEDELVGALVIEIDEAGIGGESLLDLGRDEPEHLFQVERRVDGSDRLGQQTQVTTGRVHVSNSRPPGTVAPRLASGGIGSARSTGDLPATALQSSYVGLREKIMGAE